MLLATLARYLPGHQAVGILIILLLIIEVCMLEVKNPLLRNIKFFKRDSLKLPK